MERKINYQQEMISHQHKCIFIHIPKCAGTSIEKALGHFEGHQGRGGQDHRSMREIEESIEDAGALSIKQRIDKALGRGRFSRRRGTNPNNRLVVTRKQYEEYYKFTIVRNPWARAFSWYKNTMRDGLKRKRWGFSDDLSLNEFIHHHAEKGLLRPQSHWLQSIDGSIHLDFIGRFENLRHDFEKACDMMGIRGVGLPHEIKGSGESYLDCFDGDSIGIIEDVCREDTVLFGYSFDGR